MINIILIWLYMSAFVAVFMDCWFHAAEMDVGLTGKIMGCAVAGFIGPVFLPTLFFVFILSEFNNQEKK